MWGGDCESSEEGYLAHLGMGCLGKDEEVDKNGEKGCQAEGQHGQRHKDEKQPGLWKDLPTVLYYLRQRMMMGWPEQAADRLE